MSGERDYERLVQRDDIDCVICATPWEWHTPFAVATMKAGKMSALEVPGAVTLNECWELIKRSEETKQPCYLLKNVCYFQEPLTILRMVARGSSEMCCMLKEDISTIVDFFWLMIMGD